MQTLNSDHYSIHYEQKHDTFFLHPWRVPKGENPFPNRAYAGNFGPKLCTNLLRQQHSDPDFRYMNRFRPGLKTITGPKENYRAKRKRPCGPGQKD